MYFVKGTIFVNFLWVWFFILLKLVSSLDYKIFKLTDPTNSSIGFAEEQIILSTDQFSLMVYSATSTLQFVSVGYSGL